VSGSISSSLFGTASYATQALSSSYALTASYALSGGSGGGGAALTSGSLYNITSSWANTASFAITASFVNSSSYALTASYALSSPGGAGTIAGINSTGSVAVNKTSSQANLDISGSVFISGSLNVSGSIFGTTKSFLIKHPTKAGMSLQYGSLESPYHGVRLTDEGKIVNGECTIKLPDYIHGLVKQEGSQVQITNIKHNKVIWVENIDIENDQFTVKCDIETVESNKEYNFYWSFTGIRKDIEDLEVEL
jgi:hypothetical protein